jgi:hypothetical protein
MTIYQALVGNGEEIDNHESDLYVKATDSALRIVRAAKVSFSTFTSNIDGALWIEIPLAFDPFWSSRT